MKIRTDFVTNSSSSSFAVEIEVRSADCRVCMSEYPSSDVGEASFNGDLRNVNSHLSSVEELATWLASSIEPDWNEKHLNSLRQRKAKFVKDACVTFGSVRDIESITVTRRYEAWGEFADLVADGDSRLTELAEAYVKSSGHQKKRAKAEMITYIQTSSDARGESFGANSGIARYNWDGKSIDELAKRLCSHYGPDYVRGIERKHLDMITGEYFDTSDFDLA